VVQQEQQQLRQVLTQLLGGFPPHLPIGMTAAAAAAVLTRAHLLLLPLLLLPLALHFALLPLVLPLLQSTVPDLSVTVDAGAGGEGSQLLLQIPSAPDPAREGT
jgi:hypothetical protein